MRGFRPPWEGLRLSPWSGDSFHTQLSFAQKLLLRQLGETLKQGPSESQWAGAGPWEALQASSFSLHFSQAAEPSAAFPEGYAPGEFILEFRLLSL